MSCCWRPAVVVLCAQPYICSARYAAESVIYLPLSHSIYEHARPARWCSELRCRCRLLQLQGRLSSDYDLLLVRLALPARYWSVQPLLASAGWCRYCLTTVSIRPGPLDLLAMYLSLRHPRRLSSLIEAYLVAAGSRRRQERARSTVRRLLGALHWLSFATRCVELSCHRQSLSFEGFDDYREHFRQTQGRGVRV